jgi:5-methylcytosine-specific restriction endonuclease McrA
MCKTCFSAFHAQYYAENTEKVKLKNRKLWVERMFGVSLDEIEKIKTEQKGLCAICEDKLQDRHLVHIDHDHKTGQIRGILCRWCNTGLGQFKDSEERLTKAIQYLNRDKGTK